MCSPVVFYAVWHGDRPYIYVVKQYKFTPLCSLRLCGELLLFTLMAAKMGYDKHKIAA
jgi:hypothetical protein